MFTGGVVALSQKRKGDWGIGRWSGSTPLKVPFGQSTGRRIDRRYTVSAIAPLNLPLSPPSA
jgi:hypothetical protein